MTPPRKSTHLTATDKRNIRAVLAQPSFIPGQSYKVNGRKSYTLSPCGTDPESSFVVEVAQTEIDGFGRRSVRKDLASFTIDEARRISVDRELRSSQG